MHMAVYSKILKKLSKAFILSIVLASIATIFYNLTAQKTINLAESILIIRCFIILELFFSKKTLYNLTPDPFDLLAIHLALSPYYLAFVLYLLLKVRWYNKEENTYLLSPFLISFGIVLTSWWIYKSINSLYQYGIFISIKYYPKEFLEFGGVNILGIALQFVAKKNLTKIF